MTIQTECIWLNLLSWRQHHLASCCAFQTSCCCNMHQQALECLHLADPVTRTYSCRHNSQMYSVLSSKTDTVCRASHIKGVSHASTDTTCTTTFALTMLHTYSLHLCTLRCSAQSSSHWHCGSGVQKFKGSQTLSTHQRPCLHCCVYIGSEP